MLVKCNECNEDYDDLDHWTTCPHDYFEMRTMAHRGDGGSKLCTSVEELTEFMADDYTAGHG